MQKNVKISKKIAMRDCTRVLFMELILSVVWCVWEARKKGKRKSKTLPFVELSEANL